jgi:hypothetical protein
MTVEPRFPTCAHHGAAHRHCRSRDWGLKRSDRAGSQGFRCERLRAGPTSARSRSGDPTRPQYVSGFEICRQRLTGSFLPRFGYPYRVGHRADVHRALLDAVRGYPDQLKLNLGQAVRAFEQDESTVTVTLENGASCQPALLPRRWRTPRIRSYCLPRCVVGARRNGRSVER